MPDLGADREPIVSSSRLYRARETDPMATDPGETTSAWAETAASAAVSVIIGTYQEDGAEPKQRGNTCAGRSLAAFTMRWSSQSDISSRWQDLVTGPSSAIKVERRAVNIGIWREVSLGPMDVLECPCVVPAIYEVKIGTPCDLAAVTEAV